MNNSGIYGKNPAVKAAADAHNAQNPLASRQVANMLNNIQPRRTNNKVPAWKLRYTPTVDPTGDSLVILPGAYDTQVPVMSAGEPALNTEGEPIIETHKTIFHMTRNHYSPVSGRPTTCSGGPLYPFAKYRQPCRGCELHYDVDRDLAGCTPCYNITVLNLGSFIEEDDLDAKGDVKRNDKGYAYRSWKKLTQQQVRTTYKNQADKMVDHLKQYWSLSSAQWAALWAFNDRVGTVCKNCQSEVFVEAWECPQCTFPHLNFGERQFTDKEIEDTTSNPIECEHCGFHGYLREKLVCEDGNCSKSERTTIFMGVINVSQTITPQANGKNKYTLNFNGFKVQDLPSKFTKSNTGEDPIATPFDLPEMLKPTPYEEQEKIFGKAAPVRTMSATVAYGKSGTLRTPVEK